MSDDATPAKVRLTDGLGPNAQDDEHPYTYASTQATHCAGCGEYKHTPLRIDAMGGYVCLTCIDRKLGAVLGELGYPAPQQSLTARKLLAWLQRSKDGMLLESQIVGYVHENMDRYMSVAVFEAWATQRATAAERDQWRPVTWADGQGNEAIDLRQPRERQMLARVTDLLAARLGTNADEWEEVSEAREGLDGPPTAPPVGPTAVGPAA